MDSLSGLAQGFAVALTPANLLWALAGVTLGTFVGMLWVRLLSIPRDYLYAVILVLASVGAYSVNRSAFDVGLLHVVGIVGYLMRRHDIPLAPAIIGLILGPMAEQQFRRALAAADGSWSIFVSGPIAASLLLTAAVLVALPWIRKRI